MAAILAALPDADFLLGIALGQGDDHGTFTHSLLAVAVVALLAGMVAGRQ